MVIIFVSYLGTRLSLQLSTLRVIVEITEYVTIHHETSVKSPLGNFQFTVYLESTYPKL